MQKIRTSATFSFFSFFFLRARGHMKTEQYGGLMADQFVIPAFSVRNKRSVGALLCGLPGIGFSVVPAVS
jgi:hypothetical protein